MQKLLVSFFFVTAPLQRSQRIRAERRIRRIDMKYTTGGPVETGIVLKSSLSVAEDELFFGSDDGYVCVPLDNWTTLLIRD